MTRRSSKSELTYGQWALVLCPIALPQTILAVILNGYTPGKVIGTSVTPSQVIANVSYLAQIIDAIFGPKNLVYVSY